MGKVISYLKRGIKYVLYEHKQPIVKVEIVQKTPNRYFEEKLFIVTGGGSGLGYSIAKKLIEENAKVIITGRNVDKLKVAQKELGKNCFYETLDMKSVDLFNDFMFNVYDKYGEVDGIINNAGISLHEWDFMKVDPEKYDQQFNTNLRGSYFFTQSYIKYYLSNKQTSGKIIFISSERGTYCDDLPYGLTKASIDSLSRALSIKYYKDGLNINAVCPGVTATQLTGIDKNDDLYTKQNSQRFFIPEEVSEVVLFLLSDYSKCVSGETIHTNAGNHLRRGY